jgi:hypothetical protein
MLKRLCFLAATCAAATLSCAPNGSGNVDIVITAGQEGAAEFSDAGAVCCTITATSLDGTVDVSAYAPPVGITGQGKCAGLTSNSFDLGDVDPSELLGFVVSCVNAAGTNVMGGQSLSGIPAGDVEDGLPIFVEPFGVWARPPGGLLDTHVAGLTGVTEGNLPEQDLVLGGGTSVMSAAGTVGTTSNDEYDLFALQGTTGADFPAPPTSLDELDTSAFVFSGSDAWNIDFGESSITSLTPPAGLASFADVAGGATIQDPAGDTYIVGATRSGTPTDAVLKIANADGTLSAIQLTVKRAGAAALWTTAGLLVVGGSSTGSGAELISAADCGVSSLPFPHDPTVGAGAVVTTSGVLLVGGTTNGAPAYRRTLDPTCGTGCNFMNVGQPLPALDRVAAFNVGTQDGVAKVLAVGSDAKTAATRTFLVGLSGDATELLLKEPRRGASVVPTSNGYLAILGGLHTADGSPAFSVEMLLPFSE